MQQAVMIITATEPDCKTTVLQKCKCGMSIHPLLARQLMLATPIVQLFPLTALFDLVLLVALNLPKDRW